MFERMEFGGSGGGDFSEELLWTNPNPSANFSAQTINESSSGWVSGKSLSDYSYIGIKFASSHTTSGYVYTTFWFKKGEIDRNSTWSTSAGSTGSAFRGRIITDITNSGVVFGDAVGGTSYGTPYTIWGLRIA